MQSNSDFSVLWRLLLQTVDSKVASALAGVGATGRTLPDASTPVTLDADALALLTLSAQTLGLQDQAANKVLAGPATGAASAPTFRSLVAADVPSSLTNPMTTAGDLIVGDTGGTPIRLAKGADGTVLTIDPSTHLEAWLAALTNPMTTEDDLIVGGVSGAPSRLAKGTDGQVLTVNPATHHAAWVSPVGGATIYSNASPPASPATDDIWIPSDAYYIFRYTGSAWLPIGLQVKNTALPINGNFAWVNQGPATVTATGGALVLASGGHAASDNLRIRKKATPSTPYTVTIRMEGGGYLGVNYLQYGLCLRDSASGKVVTWAVGYGNTIRGTKWNSPTAYSADYSNYPFYGQPWLRIQDDGTNRSVWTSFDGMTFYRLSSISRTDFITPDEIGFFVNANNASADQNMSLLSWQEA